MELQKTDANVWSCQLCCSNFTKKSSLLRHQKSIHLSSSKLFKCDECSRSFNRADKLKEHVVTHQADRFVFECWHCSKKFHYKRSLVDHITALHPPADPCIFKCAYCSKTFRYKGTLKRHISTLHQPQFNFQDGNNNVLNNFFECKYCCATFNQKCNLDRHIHKIHLVKKQKKCHLKCVKCLEVFCHSKWLNKHYIQVHGVKLTYENLEFSSVESYNHWLEEEQHQTVTQYCTWFKKKFPSHISERRICHRSRDFHSQLNVDNRKRCLKTNGYKKLGGICPAYIQVRIQDGKCFVLFQKTHVGHKIRDKSELGLIFTTKAEKIRIASKIQAGIPLGEIVNEERLAGFSDENISRLGILNRKDVHNIATSWGLNFEARELVLPKFDLIDDDTKIVAHRDDILFYKKQTEKDLRFNMLREKDFVLVIMTKNQEMYLKTYGHKVICMDSTDCTSLHGFLLHTLLVIDTDLQGLPAAFLLTNRNDRDVIDIFLTCIRDRVGIVETQTLICDMQMIYHGSWVRIMETPERFIFCTWHVQDDWRKNYNKITDKKKRDAVLKELKRLPRELDPIIFETDLNSFLSRKDDDLTTFQDYFRDNYVDSTPQWAYCYQNAADINTNMHLESFRRTYKHFIAGGLQITSLPQYVEYIFKFLNLLEATTAEKKIRGKVTRKLSILRNRHRLALTEYEKDGLSKVIVTDSDTFFIQSFRQRDTFYTVSKNELKDCIVENERCGLYCDSCHCCFHTFKCTCKDASITSNMCKHIHLVGLYLRHQQPSESDISSLYLVSSVANVDNTNAEIVPETNTESRVKYETANVDKCRQKLDEAIQNLITIKMTSTENQMNYIYDKYLCHIPVAIDTLKMSIPVQSQIAATSGTGKIQSQEKKRIIEDT